MNNLKNLKILSQNRIPSEFKRIFRAFIQIFKQNNIDFKLEDNLDDCIDKSSNNKY